MSTIKYGWHQRKLPYHLGAKFKPMFDSLDKLPQQVDWATRYPGWPSVYDQGDTGSCVGQGLKRGCHVAQIIQGMPTIIEPSSMFIYYNAREPEGATGSDDGANVCDGLLGLITEGFCSEGEWSLNPDFVTVAPSDALYDKAQMHRVMDYVPTQVDVSDIQALFEALAAGPIVGGILAFDSFERPDVIKTGVVPMPDEDTEDVIGGHCMLWRGYDLDTQDVLFDQSWGTSYGDNGRGRMPAKYLQRYGSDFWRIESVS